MLKSGSNHWGGVAKFFHWTIVLLILTQAYIGLTMVNMPRSPAVIPWFNYHKSIGITVLALAVLRLTWRLFDPRPGEPATMPRSQAIAARGGHALLYALLFLVPLSGWWYDSVAALRPLYFFGWFELPHLGAPDPDNPGLKDIARARHEWLFWALAIVALGHAAAALFHQFVSRDNILARMWPASLQRKSRPSNRADSNPPQSNPSQSNSPQAASIPSTENSHAASPAADSAAAPADKPGA